jgi:hypothetical protein
MWVVRAGVAVAVRPRLWPTAVRQVFVLARPGWWRTAPYLPRPDPTYLRFRLQTMYGGTGLLDGGAGPRADDVITYLEWCRSWPAASGTK